MYEEGLPHDKRSGVRRLGYTGFRSSMADQGKPLHLKWRGKTGCPAKYPKVVLPSHK